MGFIIPFIAFYSPELLFEGSLGSTVYVTITAILLLFALAFASAGYGFKRKLSWIERLLFFVAAVLFVVPHNYVAFGVGCAVIAIGLALERLIKIKDSSCLAM